MTAIEQHSGFRGILGEIDVADVLLREPHAEHLVVRVPEAQPERHAVNTTVVQALCSGKQHPSDHVSAGRPSGRGGRAPGSGLSVHLCYMLQHKIATCQLGVLFRWPIVANAKHF